MAKPLFDLKDANAHLLTLEVRDYECDMADGVNNAVYFQYLEHARHVFLKGIGVDFAELARQRVGLVLTKIEAMFQFSLVSGDRFEVRTKFERLTHVRFQFKQAIFRHDGQPIMHAVIGATPINSQLVPEVPEAWEPLLARHNLASPFAS